MNVRINYTNWKGVTSDRLIRPLRVRWGTTEWHPEGQWLLDAMDLDKNDIRTFAMKDVHSWNPVKEESNDRL